MREALEGALAEAARSKTMTMEHSVARLRAIVIFFNVAVWFPALGPGSPREELAWLVIVTAVPYAIWSVAGRPYERFPLLRFGFATLAMDAALIGVWFYATGGAESPFWVITIISIISVAMRYDLWQTIGTAFVEALMIHVISTIDGGLSPLDTLVRPVYIVLAGLAAGLLARQERNTREESVAFEQLAAEHHTLLERERETVEQLRLIDRMKSEFFTHASHELRTPLTTLSGLAVTLAERGHELSTEQHVRALEAMSRQGARAKQLIENLLDLSQLENGVMPVELAPVSLESTIKEILAVDPPPDGRHITVDLVEDGPVMADRQRFGQVLHNLLINAYRYGGPNITWVSRRTDDESVELILDDDGSGVPGALVPFLFQPFRRGDNVGGNTGSGLGLAISQRLITTFGGELTYEARTPGARFLVKLPKAS